MGPPFLAEHPEKMLEGWLLEGVDDIGSAHPMARHAHVERAVMREGEAARAVIELHGRHADVEQDAIDALDTGRRHEIDHLGEAPFEQHQAIAENPLERPAVADGARIAVDGVDPRLRPFEQQAGVAAGAERAVDIDAAVLRRECGNDLLRHHRQVPGCCLRVGCRRHRDPKSDMANKWLMPWPNSAPDALNKRFRRRVIAAPGEKPAGL